MKYYYLPLVLIFVFFVSCDIDDHSDIILEEEELIEDTTTVIIAACDSSYFPIIMLHGFLASGDTYSQQFQRFESNGYCSDRLFAFDWNTLDQAGDVSTALDSFIDEVLSTTDAEKVNLMGHSAGSGACFNFLQDSVRANKVNKYVHLAGAATASAAGPNAEIPTLNIWSTYDFIVPGGEIPDAVNISFSDKDHYEVATSAETFNEIFKFFNNEDPETLDITEADEIVASGKVLSFGENFPTINATVNVYELNENDGTRVNELPEFELTTNESGEFEEVSLKKNTYYEFEVVKEGTRKVHYYREPFKRSDQLVYLRTLPASGIASLLLGDLPQDAEQAVIAFYSGSSAVIHERDELLLNDFELSTEEFCSADNSTIAMFFYDGNDNLTSDYTSIGGVWELVPVFLAAIDVFTQTTEQETISVNFNGRNINVPNLNSDTEGVIVVQFN